MKKICLMLVAAFMLSLSTSVFADYGTSGSGTVNSGVTTSGSAVSVSCASMSKEAQFIVNGNN